MRRKYLPDLTPFPATPDAPTSNIQRNADIEVYQHGIRAWVDTVKEQIDATAVNEAATAAGEEEMRTYDTLMSAAGDSAVKQELAARLLNVVSDIDCARLSRRFR